MMAHKNIVWCDGWTSPDVVRTWIQKTFVDDVGCLRQKCSPLLFGKGLTLAGSIETLSNRLNESFQDTILIACARCIP